ncbi:MAG: Uma2 family endonuclease, partial [Aquifex sp.]
MTTTLKKWTYKEYLKLPEDKRYEIVNGELIEMPAPTTTHQRIVKKLLRFLDYFVERNNLGEVFV